MSKAKGRKPKVEKSTKKKKKKEKYEGFSRRGGDIVAPVNKPAFLQKKTANFKKASGERKNVILSDGVVRRS
jgi:hypothetical protein